ncbi:LysR family transcriptional regulator [Jatrophihabitans sp. YIM 134969]
MTTLRALECLVAVADAGSITEAARVLHLSQPAVSHQLAELEREARTSLFHRGRRGVTLTPAGAAALPPARHALESAAAAVRSARSVGEGATGRLRVACAQSLTVPLIAPVVRQWHRRRAGVDVVLRESAIVAELLGWVDSGAVDVAVMPEPVPAGYGKAFVTDEEIVVTASPDHPFAARDTVRLRQLDGEPLVHFAVDNGLSAWLDRALTDAGVRPEVVMRTTITSAAPQLAAAGIGIAVTPVSAVSAGLPGTVRSFRPRWTRVVVAVTASTPDALTGRFVEDLRTRGLRVPRDITRKLTDVATDRTR